MDILVISQGNAAGTALLAAYALDFRARLPSHRLYAILDFKHTEVAPFWSRTTAWLLGEQGAERPQVLQIDRACEVNSEWQPEREKTALVLLRLPLNDWTPESKTQSIARLRALAEKFDRLIVLSDWSCGPSRWDLELPVEAVVVQAQNPRSRISTAPEIAPTPEVQLCLALAAACLYEPGHEQHSWDALKLHCAVREDCLASLRKLLNCEPLPDCPLLQVPLDLPALREGDFLLLRLPDRLSGSEAPWAKNSYAWLEHILQAALRMRQDVQYGMGYIESQEGVSLVFAKAYRSGSARSLQDRVKEFPWARDFSWQTPRGDYAKQRFKDWAEFRVFLTSFLPALTPELSLAVRCQGVVTCAPLEAAADRMHVHAIPGSLCPSQGSHPWHSEGDTERAGHPLWDACLSLSQASAKADRIRAFFEARIRSWHNVKDPTCTPELLQAFRAQFLSLVKRAQLPWPSDDFDYKRREQDWLELRELLVWASRSEKSGPPFSALQGLFGSLQPGPDDVRVGRYGPADDRAFILYEAFRGESWAIPAGWIAGFEWASNRAHCLMWADEVRERVLTPFFENLTVHCGHDFHFLRIHTTVESDWVTLRLLTSGPGVNREALQEKLVKRSGMRQARDTVLSYGGEVTFLCREGGLVWRGGEAVVQTEDPMKIVVFGPKLADGNQHIEWSEDTDRADLVIADDEVHVSGHGKRKSIKKTRSELADWLGSMVGFCLQLRFKRL